MKKIIIAESVLRDVGTGTTLFGRGGITIVPAPTAEDILQLHRENKADLLVIDYSQPVMGGARLCAIVRSDPALKDVSLIVVCDQNGRTRADCEQAQVNAVLTRPVDPFDFFARISELLVIPQRQDVRTVLHVSVSGREGMKTFLAMSHNISISGMLLEADYRLEKGARLNCVASIGGREIVADCEVVRARESSPGKFKYGVRFSNLDTKSMIIIEQYVKGNIKH